MLPDRSPSSERKPCGQGSGLVFRTPGPRNRLPERGQRGAELQLRPLKHFRRRGLKIAMTPGRARQLASSSGIFDDASEKLTLEGMDPNVFVSDALRVDQAAHDNSNAPDPVTGVPVVPNHLGHRVPSEALHCGEQLRQLRTAASSGTEPGMVRLSRVRYGWVTQLDPTAVHYLRRCGSAPNQHSAGPAGLHREANSRKGWSWRPLHPDQRALQVLVNYCTTRMR